MIEVTRYVAHDGSEWEDVNECRERDLLIMDIQVECFRLNIWDTPESTTYANGGGYVQHPAGSRDCLLGWLKSRGATNYSDGPLGRLMRRVHKMDDKDREWGQPYYALHPHEGEQYERVMPS